MERLIAKVPVLYLSHQYKIGEELPANDRGMVDAWIEAESAFWMEDSGNNIEDVKVKGIPVTAEPGQEGAATPSSAENLAGKIPKIVGRKK